MRLMEGEAPFAGLLRIVREEVDSAIANLRAGEEGVHEARKSIKKIRAILRLLGRPSEEHNLLRDMAHRLAASRDAAAMVETVTALREKYPADPALEHLDALLPAPPSQPPDLRATPLLRFRRLTRAWQSSAEGFEVLAPGLRQTYRKGRKALAGAKKDPTPDNFHRLRRRVKDHWYHVRLLTTIWKGPMEAREACLKDLQEWLGDDHNLAVLRTHSGAEPASDLIGNAQRELRKRAVSLAEKVYAESTGCHLRRLKRLWRLSHSVK